MLVSYVDLFVNLELEKCEYCIYKGLNHLEDDLNGKRGDVDILVSESTLSRFEQIALKCGFKKSMSQTSYPNYYLKRDEQTGRMAMIDLDVKLRFGQKPQPFHLRPNWNEMKIAKKNIDGTILNVLDTHDYLPLMLMMRITSNHPQKSTISEICILYNEIDKEKLNCSYFSKILMELTRSSENELYDNINDFLTWDRLQVLYKQTILDSLGGSKLRTSIRLFIYLYYSWYLRLKARLKKVIKQPPYHLHQGVIIGMIGVDGAGKSSAVDAVLNDQFYKVSGVKRIYFGNGEYWFPGLNWMSKSFSKMPVFRYILLFLKNFDRQMRSLWALYLRKSGNVVLCDRYYYDDECGKVLRNKNMKNLNAFAKFKRKISSLIQPRMIITPDLTLFFNVSPAVAYTRKKDFSYETMLEVNQCYREIMKNRPEVVFIDADQEHSKVLKDMFLHISSFNK